MNRYTGLLAPALILLLSACDQKSAPAPEAPSEPPTEQMASPAPPPVASIIRPELDEAPEPETLLEPLMTNIGFPGGGAKLDAAALAELGQLLKSPQIAEGWPIILRGHTDSVGYDGDNLVASRRRAEAVSSWLTSKGVEEDRITIYALGEMRPIAPNALPDGSTDEKGRAANRRVEILIAPPPKKVPDEAEGFPGDAPPIMDDKTTATDG